MVNKQPGRVNRRIPRIKKIAIVVLKESCFNFFLIDVSRLSVYHDGFYTPFTSQVFDFLPTSFRLRPSRGARAKRYFRSGGCEDAMNADGYRFKIWYHKKMSNQYGAVTKDSISIFLIDSFRLFVYHKINYIDCRMKRERFADIYLRKAK